MKIARVVLSLSSGFAVACTLIGCAAKPVPQRAAGIAAGDAGSSSAVVFASPELLAVPGSREIAQSDWRDDVLSIRPVRTAYEQAAWPDIKRPAFDRARRVILSTQATSVTYFRTEGVQTRSERGYVLP